MKNISRIVITVLVLAAIIFAIVVLEKMKVQPPVPGQNKTGNTQQDLLNNLSINGNIETSPEILSILSEKEKLYPKAPEITGTQDWINTEPLTLEKLRGKVVLLDIWTYSCINCLRTLPYLKQWHEKYSGKGLVIIGVHTPEFEFEKKLDNLKKAVKKHGLTYPIVQDNNYAVWNAYKNRYWPRKFLIDRDGYIRYDHIGEGGYQETEQKIIELLSEHDTAIGMPLSSAAPPADVADSNFYEIGTPEIYLGFEFSRGNFGNAQGFKARQTIAYQLPSELKANHVYLEGTWKNNADNMELVGEKGSIILPYKAKQVNIVAGSEMPASARIVIDGNDAHEQNKGSDVIISNGVPIANITDYKLYNIVTGNDYGQHTVRIDVTGKGFKLFTFTFG